MAIDPGVVGLLDLCNAAVSALFLWVALRRRDRPGRTGFLVVVVGIVVWSVAIGVDKFFLGRDVSIAAYNVVFLGGQIASIGWFLLAIEFTGVREPTRRLMGTLAALIVAGQAVFWTNPVHGLILRPGTTVENASLAPVYGPAFYPILLTFYGFVIVGTALLLWDAVGSSGVRRQQDLVLSVAILPPLAASVVSVLDLAFAPYDVTPFGFLLAEILFAWVLFRLQFLGVVSAGRKRAIEALPDAVLTLDADGDIVDANEAAGAVLGVSERNVGQPAIEVLKWHPELVRLLERESVDGQEVTLTVDGERRHYRLTVSSFEAGDEPRSGRVLVFRDVTTRRRREEDLQAREREREDLRRVLTGMLERDLRGSLQRMEDDADTLAERFADGRGDVADAILDQVASLEDLRRKVMAVSWLADRRETATYDLAALAETTVADARERYPDATFEVTTEGPCRVEASDGIDLALENLIENAVVHGGDRPTVSVRIESSEDRVTLVVADDGPGIPEAELAVIERESETQHHHSTGIGLWLVKLVADHSGATMEFATDEGTTVTIDFPTPEREEPASEDHAGETGATAPERPPTAAEFGADATED